MCSTIFKKTEVGSASWADEMNCRILPSLIWQEGGIFLDHLINQSHFVKIGFCFNCCQRSCNLRTHYWIQCLGELEYRLQKFNPMTLDHSCLYCSHQDHMETQKPNRKYHVYNQSTNAVMMYIVHPGSLHRSLVLVKFSTFPWVNCHSDHD